MVGTNGAPGESRTPDLLVRSPVIDLRVVYFQKVGVAVFGRNHGVWAGVVVFCAAIAH
jgi:hypothetical protein